LASINLRGSHHTMARFQLRAWAVQFELAKSWLINQNNNQAISGSYGQTSDTSTKLKFVYSLFYLCCSPLGFFGWATTHAKVRPRRVRDVCV